jgi:predicted kinase
MTVYVLIGPPLSGKSTFKKKHFPNAFNICRDDIILSLALNVSYEEAFKIVNQKEVDTILKSKLESASNFQEVVIDMTNMTSKRRKYNLSFFPNHKKVAILFNFPTDDEYFLRNQKRIKEENKSISYGVFKNILDSFTPIKENENFDKIFSTINFYKM